MSLKYMRKSGVSHQSTDDHITVRIEQAGCCWEKLGREGWSAEGMKDSASASQHRLP